MEREKEIIKQEIKMYEDDPSWKTYFHVVQSMYESHPVRDNVAGSEESVRLIDRKTLAEFYQAFYRPEFMTLVVTGNVHPQQVISIAEEELKPKEGPLPGRIDKVEDSDVDTECKEVSMPLRIPFFTMGFRQNPVEDSELLKRVYGTKMLLELLWGEGSRLFQRMYEDGLLTEPPAVQVSFGRSFRFTVVSAKTSQPKRTAQLLWDALYEAKSKEIKARDLDRIRKKFMGRLYRRTQSIDAVCMDQIDLGVFGLTLFDAFDVVREMNETMLEKILREDFCAEARAFSSAGKLH